MVVNANEFGYATLDRPLDISNKYTKSDFYSHLKASSYVHGKIKVDVDFIVGTAKGSFKVIEVNKRTERVSTRQISSYLRMLPAIPERSVEDRLERLEKQFNNLVRSTWGYLFAERDIKEMGELSKGMLEDSKKMRELAQKLQDTDDEG